MSLDTVGALEIGGSHVTSALVRGDEVGELYHGDLDPGAPAGALVDAFAAAMQRCAAPAGTPWAVALPGPFDYAAGVGRYAGVGKFDSLNGVDLGARLRAVAGSAPVVFLNDADAFAIGEWNSGVGKRAGRCVGITLGSGVGSAFLDRGTPVTSGDSVPPEGEMHFTRVDGVALEDLVSRRAIVGRYASRAGDPALDVKELFEARRLGDAWAGVVLADAFATLGRALAPWLRAFGAEVVMVGGGMAGGWDFIEPVMAREIGPGIPLRRAADTVRAALLGAAVHLRAGG